MDSDNHSDEDAVALYGLLKRELLSVPIEHWGYFFPCHLAAWRFIQMRRQHLLGDLKAGYDEEPYFIGQGSDWFTGVLGEREQYISALERIMNLLTSNLSQKSLERGFLCEEELPPIPLVELEKLAMVLLDAADMQGVKNFP